MKILFISANQEKGFRPALPIGLVTLATQARYENHEVFCLDLCFANSFHQLDNMLDCQIFDLIAVSLRNIDQQSYLEPTFLLPAVRNLCELCREKQEQAKIIVGGPAFTLMPVPMLRYLQADFGLVGPAENSFLLFLNKFEKNQDTTGIPGLVYSREGDYVYNSVDIDIINDYGRFPFIDYNLYDQSYFSGTFKGPTPLTDACVPILAKRGCPFSCIYCANSHIACTKYNLKQPQTVVKEIEMLIDFGKAKRYEFADGAFNAPAEHALAICDLMASLNIHFPWNCMFTPAQVTENLVCQMKKTGCDLVEMGTESGSDHILKNLQKPFLVKHIRQSHYLIDQFDITAEHCIFLGSPGENYDSIMQTFDLMEELVTGNHHLYITFGYRIFKNTPIYDLALDRNIITAADDLLVPAYFVEPDLLNDERLLEIIQERVINHENWYLWWGLPKISLQERIADVQKEYAKLNRLYKMLMQEEQV